MSTLYSYAVDAAYALTNCLSCFPSSPNLKINGRSFKMLRLLGEGGFSYVYLVHPTDDASKLYAVKKIRCPFGQESVAQALREVEAYALFAPHPNIIQALDHAVVSEKAGGSSIGADGAAGPAADGKTVYILLPYYSRGNLQDAINANLVNHTRMGERRLLTLVLGVCRALRSMHNYAPGERRRDAAARVRSQAAAADADTAVAANSSRRRATAPDNDGDADDDDDEPLLEGTGSAGEPVAPPPADGASRPRCYVHRDIKPGNIMIGSDGRTPVLMDLGSLAPGPTVVSSRSHALAVQDAAAEHSTMPYRAPELFDVRVGATLDGAADVWSLGCTIYACLVGKSPFERRSEETGGSLTMCVLGGDWRWPDEVAKRKPSGNLRAAGQQDAAAAEPGADVVVSDGVKELVAACLRIEPAERPDVERLAGMVQDCIAQLPRDGGGDD